MGLIVVAADKGAPGVTTTALALAAVWPRSVLLAECDPAGGDLAYRFPAADGQRLDPRRGMLSLAVTVRHGIQPGQVWEHTQKLHGGIDVLLGVTNAEQGASLSMFWGQLGRVLAAVPQADVIADCGRLGTDGPAIDLLAEASQVILLTRAEVGEVIRLRDRAVALAAAIEKRGRRGFTADVVVIADQKNFKAELAEVDQVLSQGMAPARVFGGIAFDPRAAGLLRGPWGGKLDKSLLVRSVREIAGQVVATMPAQAVAALPGPGSRPPVAAQAAPQAEPRPDPRPGYQEPRFERPSQPRFTAHPGYQPAPQVPPAAGPQSDGTGQPGRVPQHRGR
jgi:MinD-like ATPase involved in chromosome partitioning or flagellar assembly